MANQSLSEAWVNEVQVVEKSKFENNCTGKIHDTIYAISFPKSRLFSGELMRSYLQI